MCACFTLIDVIICEYSTTRARQAAMADNSVF